MAPTSFANQVVWITGAGSGIGRELAVRLAAEGAAVAVTDRRDPALKELEHDLAGQRVAAWVADVTDPNALQQAADGIQQQLGPIDLVIACAGVGYATPALGFTPADMENIIGVNLLGVVNTVHAVLPSMLRRKQGHIVALSSLASYRGIPMMAGYCASKAGLNAVMDSFRVELRRSGIRLTTICPGWIRTPMTAPIQHRLPGILELPRAVDRILDAIRRKKDFAAFPAALVWRLRVMRWLPQSISDWLMARGTAKMKQV